MRQCPVSVIIPHYNRGEMVVRAVRSVMGQSLACMEVIVVDDGSTDDSVQHLLQTVDDNHRKKNKNGWIYPELRLIKQENQGPSAARNRGIKEARFPFLAFLDSDDHWHKDKLDSQYSALCDNPGYLISHTYERWLRRGRHLNQKKIHIPRHGDIFEHCLRICAVGMSTVMVRREFFTQVGLFDETMRCCEDYDLWLRASHKLPFLLVDSPLTVKEGGRDDQLSAIYRQGMDRFRIYSLSKLVDSGALSAEHESMARQELLRRCTIYADGCVKHGRKEEEQKYRRLIAQYC